MNELIVSKQQLIQMFEDKIIVDSGKAWLMNNKIVDIIAIHEVDPKFLQDITNAKFYKIITTDL